MKRGAAVAILALSGGWPWPKQRRWKQRWQLWRGLLRWRRRMLRRRLAWAAPVSQQHHKAERVRPPRPIGVNGPNNTGGPVPGLSTLTAIRQR